MTVDGAQVARAATADPTLAAGQVILGVATDGDSSFGKAAFADAEIRSR